MEEKNHSSSVSQNGTPADDANRLEAVRDLLFGQADNEYREEFKAIRGELGEAKEELRSELHSFVNDLTTRFDEFEKEIIKKIEATENRINEEISSVKESYVDKKGLANMLKEVAKTLDS